MIILNIKQLPSLFKEQIKHKLDLYSLITIVDDAEHKRPQKVYVHFSDFRLAQLKSIYENKKIGQISSHYLYLADIAFTEDGTIIKDRY